MEQENFTAEIPAFGGRITISAGLSTFPADGADRDVLFSLANQALLRAKRSGHNRVCIAAERPAPHPEEAGMQE